jgi:hypothetical protein
MRNVHGTLVLYRICSSAYKANRNTFDVLCKFVVLIQSTLASFLLSLAHLEGFFGAIKRAYPFVVWRMSRVRAAYRHADLASHTSHLVPCTKTTMSEPSSLTPLLPPLRLSRISIKPLLLWRTGVLFGLEFSRPLY